MADLEAIIREQQRRVITVPNRAPRTSGPRHAFAFTGLIAYGVVVLFATMWPTPLDQGYGASIARFLGVLHRNGVPTWFDYPELEFTANVAMFIPLGLFVALALPRRAWWASLLLLPAFSVAIETAQYFLLSARFATVSDVVANTIGGYIGVVVAVVIRAAVYARDERVIARADWERAVGRR